MAPVMSSVTVASCVRSPSATVCSSFISRRMAAWLASLTRLGVLAGTLGFEPLAFGGQLHARGPRAPARSRSRRPAPGRPATARRASPPCRRRGRCARRACPAGRQRGAQRFAVGQDRGLRFARGHQALQVAQDGAGLRAGLLVGLQDGFELLAGLRVPRAGQALLGAAVEQAAARLPGRCSGPCRAGTRRRGSRLPPSGIRWPTCRCAASASPAGRRPRSRAAWRSAASSARPRSRSFRAGRTTGG